MNNSNLEINGYIGVDESVFACHYSDGVVTMLPAYDDEKKQYNARHILCTSKENVHEYHYGYADNYNIAFLRKGPIQCSHMGYSLTARFFASMVVRSGSFSATYNKYDDWTLYQAITFRGGSINAIFSPQYALDKEERNDSTGEDVVRVLPWESYTKYIDTVIDGENVRVTISVKQDWSNNVDEVSSYPLGELNSFITLQFPSLKEFDSIEGHYGIAKNLVSLLTGQNNVRFDVLLYRQDTKGKLYNTARCEINDGYANYLRSKKTNIISLTDVMSGLSELFGMIANHKTEIITALLPSDNRYIGRITIVNVQDLCAALEVTYRDSHGHKERDGRISKLKKRIKKTIRTFVEEENIDVFAETNISSCFQYLDYTLADKINELYLENKSFVDSVTRKRGLPEVDLESIRLFTRARNNKTHNGTIDFGTSETVYMPLLAILYVEMFRKAGMASEEIEKAVDELF